VPEREFRVLVHEEDGSYWGEVVGLPGCFASGHTLDELREAIVEAITLCAEGSDVDVSGPSAARDGTRRRDARPRVGLIRT
jgi:predicted RNase H-like HicB family nuclease